jgi:hypothetical protein
LAFFSSRWRKVIVAMGSYAEWAGAVSTTSAVIAALYLGLRNDTERLTCLILLRTFQLDVIVANPTNSPTIINSVAFEVGRFRPKKIFEEWDENAHAMQRLPADVNAHASTRLTVGYSPSLPGSLPDQMRHELNERSWFDRRVYVVIEAASLRRFRFRIPTRLIGAMLEQVDQ